MKPVTVRNLTIGDGNPKICVPITGVTEAEILQEASVCTGLSADFVEWRADWYEHIYDTKRTIDMLCSLREILKEMPLLFTFRTAKEGGEKEMAADAYASLNLAVAQSRYVDLVDVEAFREGLEVEKVVADVQLCGAKVIASNHDFDGTPDKEEMIRRLCVMQELGADITKIAVMPQKKTDVLTLMGATEEMCRLYADRPVITMSMSGDGVISRFCGEIFGSAVTFGAASKASAPGQIAVDELAHILTLIHKQILGTSSYT